MTKTIEAKNVREARAAARRMAKTTDLSYQQALDRIARDSGHDHWAAFVNAHPAVEARETVEPAGSRIPEASMPERIGRHMRSLVTGERGAELDRIRTAIIIEKAAEDQPWPATDERTRKRNLWISAALNLVKMPAVITALGGLYVLFSFIPGGTDLRMSQVLHAAAIIGAVSLATFLICLAIGDHPGMERRRALAWTVMKWAQAAGFCLFLLVGFPAFDQMVGRTTHLDLMNMVMLGTGAVMLGGPLRRTLHALMALGAALGASGQGTSIADLDEIDHKAKSMAAKAKQVLTSAETNPEGAEGDGEKRPWWMNDRFAEVAIGSIKLACILSIVGFVMQFVFGIDARPLAWGAMVVFGPLMAYMMVGMAISLVDGVLQITGLDEDLAYRRVKRQRTTRPS